MFKDSKCQEICVANAEGVCCTKAVNHVTEINGTAGKAMIAENTEL